MTITLPRQETPLKKREVSTENCTRELHTQLLRYFTLTLLHYFFLSVKTVQNTLFFHRLASLFSRLPTDHLAAWAKHGVYQHYCTHAKIVQRSIFIP